MTSEVTNKEWITTAELAGLPGLPSSRRRVARALERLNVPARKRAGRGGGLEYQTAGLPPEVRAALQARSIRIAKPTAMPLPAEPLAAGFFIPARAEALARDIAAEAAHRQRCESLKALPALRETAIARLDARIAVLRELRRYAAGRSLRDAERSFAAAWNAGGIECPEARELLPTISASSLGRWRRSLAREGAARLAGAYGNRKGAGAIEASEELKTFCLGFLYEHPHTSVTHLYRGLTARFAAAERLPSLDAVRRWVTQWKRANAQTFTAVANPDAWKGSFMVSHGSQSEGVIRLNQRWEIDSTPADLLLADGRYALIGVMDVYSRRARLHVARTSRATAVAAALRRALLEWGVPEVLKGDNGAEYVGRHIARVLEGLGVEYAACPPFQPWHKPHIERFFRSFSHDLVELLPGFCGHNVSDRQALEARKSFAERLFRKNETVELRLTAAELQEFCDKWTGSIYEHRTHRELGMSPFERLAAWRAPVRRIEDERALDLLLAEAPDNHGRRAVHKQGIRLKWLHEPRHHWYIAPELEALVGETVRVSFDPLGGMERIYVFGAEGFLCAAECPELSGINRAEHAALAKHRQHSRVQAERAALREAAKAANTKGIAAEILAARERDTARVALFPKPQIAYLSAGLRAAADAVETGAAREAAPTPELSSAERAHHERLLRVDAPVFELPGDPARNYRLWQRLSARLRAGEALSASERDWITAYPQSEEFAAMQAFYASFEAAGRGDDRAEANVG